MTMVLYLDNSFLNRPFDDPNVGTNRLEAEILSFILDLVNKGRINLVNSSMIEYENSLNPFAERKIFVEEILKNAKAYQNVSEQIEKKAKNLVDEMKLRPIDALHLATAEVAGIDFFITSDYNVTRKYKGKLKVISPLEFLNYYEGTNR